MTRATPRPNKPAKPRCPRQRIAPPPALRVTLTDEQLLERAEWVLATTQRLLASASDQNMPVTGDWRVNACDADRLLGLPAGTLANLKCRGEGPVYLKMGRHVSYGLRDLALWLWAHRHDPASQGFT